MLWTHRAGKGPVGCRQWGLGSRNRRGPGMPPTPGLRGQGTSPGSPAGFLCLTGQGKCPPLLSCSSGPGGPLPLASPVLPSAFLLCPQDECGQGDGGPWRAGDLPGSSEGSLAPSGRGKRPLLLSCSSQRAPPTCLS